jgi:hypothetical protein
VGCALLIASRDAAPLFEPIHHALDTVSSPVGRVVERPVATVTGVLVAPPRNHGVDVLAGEGAAHGRLTVALVTDEASWSNPRSPAGTTPDRSRVEQGVQILRLVPLAARDDERHRLPAAFGPDVDLRREAAAASAEGLRVLPTHGTGGVLVRPYDGAVHVVGVPVESPIRISLALKGGEHVSPDAGGRPSPEPAPCRRPRTELLGQITPRGARAEHPQNGTHDGAMIPGGASGPGALGR